MRKILIMGLPGSGKTTLASLLAPKLSAVHLNGDAVREHLNRDLAFDLPDRIEHARRLGWLSDQITKAGHFAVVDFVCPTESTRGAFQAEKSAFIVWVDRIRAGRFEDTNKIFEAPSVYNIRVSSQGAPEQWAAHIVSTVRMAIMQTSKFAI
ncbi:adenylyl-sulfate kinase [Hyphomicrobium sp. MC1]|uniref:adenylyl-sulfate kinase n=1 Tax=Hyphomicrobium sp. (strain MC1) TaxID=717785 RepID=UPI000213D5B8|nr:adenylyl-sulfate kinase [Hyphomicrobium sp. MC1]CCB65032.1 putative adenylylsulphate kinase [Hyphomicrobium sp. MC1]